MSSMVPVQPGGGLSEAQQRYVDTILAGKSEKAAMKAAGYAATTLGRHISSSPAVQAAIRAGNNAVISGELLVKARMTMAGLLGPKTPAATRYSAAKWIMERNDGETDEDKVPLHMMTPAQLEAFMARAQKTIDEGGERPVIDITPNNGA